MPDSNLPITQNPTPTSPAVPASQPDTAPVPPPDVKPDGGLLGHAVLGALGSAATSSAPTTMAGEAEPATPTTMPGQAETAQTMSGESESTNTETTPSLSEQMENAQLALAGTNIPGVSTLAQIHEYAKNAEDWFDQKSQQPLTMLSPFKTAMTGMLRDTAGMVAGVTSIPSQVTTLAGIALPVPTGLYMVGHGTYNMIQGWGDITNPDVMQNELMSAAEATGGAATLGEGLTQAVRRIQAVKASAAPDVQYQNFKNAIPPSARTPYTELDWQHARPYLEAEATTGTPITDVKSTVDAADNAISKIENKLGRVVKANPDVLVGVDVLGAVRQALKDDPTVSFYETGMKAMENYRIGWERQPLGQEGGAIGESDPPLTLEKAEEIRQKMNAENNALKKSLNNYDFANMVSTNPVFAARVAAAEALRSAIYDTLDQLGVQDAQLMRLEEGSLIKIRNAANSRLYSGEQVVKTGAKPGLVRRVAQKAALGVGAAAGFEAGATIGHPLVGSAIGAEFGGEAAKMLSPERLTRDQLIERAFAPRPQPPAVAPVRVTPGMVGGTAAGAAGHAGEELPNDSVHIRGSDGSELIIPIGQLGHAFEIDPGLQIIRSK